MDSPSEGEWKVQGIRSYEEGMELLDKLVATGQTGTVFGEPVTQGEYTVITASAVGIGMGFGYGSGEAEAAGTSEGAGGTEERVPSRGEGGGGGGVSYGRPIAVVTVGPAGVEVRPVIDWLKIGIAALTAFGSMLGMLRAMSRER